MGKITCIEKRKEKRKKKKKSKVKTIRKNNKIVDSFIT